MNMLDSITGEMWIDLLGLTDPTRRLGAGRVHIVSVITLPWDGSAYHFGQNHISLSVMVSRS